MKKIIREAVREEADYLCDVTGKPAVAKLVMSFGYGSARDMDLLSVDLCSDAAEDVLKLSQSKYPQFVPSKMDGGWTECPLCRRSGSY